MRDIPPHGPRRHIGGVAARHEVQRIALTGERRLARAMLDRAIVDAETPGDGLMSHLLRLDAVLWFRGVWADIPYSLENVCDIWGLASQAVRERYVAHMPSNAELAAAVLRVAAREAREPCNAKRVWEWMNGHGGQDGEMLVSLQVVCRIAGVPFRRTRISLAADRRQTLTERAWVWAMQQREPWRGIDLATACDRPQENIAAILRAWRVKGLVYRDPVTRRYRVVEGEAA
ncbi:MAG: hypothetical protein AB7I42_22905 [Bradyrhizobium sp.]|uniref:hypothetical protein n=1 Tax=Bradyrhizobium sp. TaxID=376 RepID=UPI003D13D241